MPRIIRAFCFDQSGATSIEYALIAGFIGLVVVTAAAQIGQALIVPFQDVSAGFNR